MKDLIENLKNGLDKLPNGSDLSDVGNIIGIIVSEYVKKGNTFNNCDMNDFNNGLKHGISLIDGTHDEPISISNDLQILRDEMHKQIEILTEQIKKIGGVTGLK